MKAIFSTSVLLNSVSSLALNHKKISMRQEKMDSVFRFDIHKLGSVN